MSTLTEKLDYFKGKQKKILEMSEDFEKKKAEVVSEANAKLAELAAPLEKAKEEYKAELKAFAGVTDGERINVLDVIEMVGRVGELSR